MRLASALFAILCLAGCKGANQSTDAVRQGVLDYLAQRAGMNVAGMDITVSDVKFNGTQADAKVSMGVKGSGTVLMTKGYHLEMKDNKWTVVGSQGGDQHGATAPGAGGAPGGENPHAGGAMPAAPAAGGKMPAPEDLPPAGKKK